MSAVFSCFFSSDQTTNEYWHLPRQGEQFPRRVFLLRWDYLHPTDVALKLSASRRESGDPGWTTNKHLW